MKRHTTRSESEPQDRIGRHAPNEVIEKEKNPVIELLSQYCGPMPWLLEMAMALSYVPGHYLELAIISLLTIKAVICFKEGCTSN